MSSTATTTTATVEAVHKNIKLANELKRVGCSEHPGSYLINDISSGDVVCEECGKVVEERMICDDAEWRNFDGDSLAEKWSKCRTGAAENPFLSADFNLGTNIKMMDVNKNNVTSYSGNIVTQYKRRSVDNALVHAYKEIDDMSDRINLPNSVVRAAKALYCEMYKKIKLKGNILLIDSKTAACLYIACRQEKCPRSTREIAAIYAVNKRCLTAAIKRVLTTLGTEVADAYGTEMIDRYCGHLQMSKEQRIRARKIAEQIDKTIIDKKKMIPEVIAGTSIYLAAASSIGTQSIFSVPFHLSPQ